VNPTKRRNNRANLFPNRNFNDAELAHEKDVRSLDITNTTDARRQTMNGEL